MMLKRSVYFKLQLKKAFKHYPSVLFAAFISVLCIAAVVAGILYVNSNSENKQKVNIAIVGDMDDTYMDVAIYALQNMDDVMFSVNFMSMTEEEAKDALDKNKIIGYVHVPENYIRGIAYGRNYPAKYVSAENPQGIGGIMANELAIVLSDIITETQKGIYSAIELAEDNGADKNLDKKVDELNFEYIKAVLNRSETYSLDYVGVKDRLSYGGYYICGFIIFFLMIWGISCNKILSAKNYGLSRSLYSRGMKTYWQILCEYAGYFTVTFVTMLMVAVVFGAFLSTGDFGIRELVGADMLYCIGFVFAITPVIIMFTAMHFMLYEIFDSIVSSVLAQFIISVGLGYVSGCFYPNTFFPETVQEITAVLPSGAGFSYVRKIMADIPHEAEPKIILAYTVIFAVTAVAVRKYKLGKDGVI